MDPPVILNPTYKSLEGPEEMANSQKLFLCSMAGNFITVNLRCWKTWNPAAVGEASFLNCLIKELLVVTISQGKSTYAVIFVNLHVHVKPLTAKIYLTAWIHWKQGVMAIQQVRNLGPFLLIKNRGWQVSSENIKNDERNATWVQPQVVLTSVDNVTCFTN